MVVSSLSQDTTACIENLLNTAWSNRNINLHESIQQCTEALSLAEAVQSLPLQAHALHHRGSAYGRLGELENAVADLERGLQLSRECNDRFRQAGCLHLLSTANHFLGNYSTSIEYIVESVSLHRSLGNTLELIEALNNLGAGYGALSDYSEAARHIMEALDLCETVDKPEIRLMCLNNMGLVKEQCGEIEEALAAFDESIQIGLAINDIYSTANTYCSKINLLREAGRLQEALAAGLQVLPMAQELKNPHREALVLTNLGMTYSDLGDWKSAEETLLRAQELAEASRYGQAISTIFFALGSCYLRQNDLVKARIHLERALSEATERGEKQPITAILLRLVELYEKEGDYATALYYHRVYHNTYTALKLEDAQKLLVAQKARLAVRKAEQIAEDKRRENEELNSLIGQKAAALREVEAQASLLLRQANTDALTGLYNRRYLYDYLPNALQKSSDYGVSLTLVIADIDDFKQINDRLSHQVGDEVLKAIAHLLQSSCRSQDTVIRYGGEEFIIVLPETTLPEAQHICERMREAVAFFAWQTIHPALTVTTSIGAVTATSPGWETILTQADANLYQAKHDGKNRVVLTSEQTSAV